MFPEIGVQNPQGISKNNWSKKFNFSFFLFLSGKHWLNKGVRKQILNMIASAHNIDPLQPQQWYSLGENMILNSKVCSKRNNCAVL